MAMESRLSQFSDDEIVLLTVALSDFQNNDDGWHPSALLKELIAEFDKEYARRSLKQSIKEMLEGNTHPIDTLFDDES